MIYLFILFTQKVPNFMLNSDYFSKRHFNLNMQGFNMWLQQRYGIYFSTTDLDQQINYFHKYISFINYRQKYIQKHRKETIPVLNTAEERQIKNLLKNRNISLSRPSYDG